MGYRLVFPVSFLPGMLCKYATHFSSPGFWNTRFVLSTSYNDCTANLSPPWNLCFGFFLLRCFNPTQVEFP